MRARVLSRFGSLNLLPTKLLSPFTLTSLRTCLPRISRYVALMLAVIALPALAQQLTPAAMPTVGAITSETGATSGVFTVDKTGAAKYSIPIFAVPGTAGVTPKLSIDYDSDGGNGLLGQGWSIGGLSEITRCHQNKLQDGQNLPIQWNNQDRFCMDGQRLIYVGFGVVYKKEIDDGDIIIAFYPSGRSSPDYFRVQHKDGSFSFYGNAPTSRDPNSTTLADSVTATDAATLTRGKIIADLGNTQQILTWRLRKYQDRVGNPVWYQYSWAWGHFIAEVRYAYGANAGPDNNYGARIYFSYGTQGRTDVFDIGYVAGLAGLGNGLRMSSITSESGGATVRTYNLSYTEALGTAYTGPSHLNSIQECGVGNVCRPATNFTWQTPNFTFGATITIPPVSSSHYATVYGDVNGDGCADALMRNQYALGNCSNGSYSLGSFVTFTNDAWPNLVNSQLVDINHDGHLDLAVISNDAASARYIYIYYNQPQSDGSWKLASTSITPIYLAPTQGISGPATAYATPPFFTDLNGDGLSDVVFGLRTSSGNYSGIGVMYGQADTTQNTSSSTPYNFAGQTTLGDGCALPAGVVNQVASMGDLNGDGIADLTISLTANSGTKNPTSVGGFETPSGSTTTTFGCWAQNGGSLSSGADINGDGLADVIYALPVNTAFAGAANLSFGTGLGSVMQLPTGAQPGELCYAAGDLNGDGYADVICVTGSVAQIQLWNPHTQAFDVAGSSFSATSYSGSSIQDLNGDGVPDSIAINSGGTGSTLVNLGIDASGFRHAITKITDGLGAVTNITYENLTSKTSTHYQKLSYNTAAQSAYPQTFTWNGQPYAKTSMADYYTAINAGTDTGMIWEQTLGKNEAPMSELTGSKWAVVSVDQSMPSTTSSAIGNVNGAALHRTSYYYGEGKVENSIRGFLGFQTIKVVDEGSGLQTITRYRQDFPFIGKPFQTDVYTNANQLVSTTWTWWGFQNWGSTLAAPYQVAPEPLTVARWNYEPTVTGNPLVSSVVTTNTFDAALSKVSEQVDVKDSANNIVSSTLTTNTYSTAANDNRDYWGLPSTVTIQSSRPNQTTLTLTRTYGFNYYCFDTSPCPATNMSGLLYQKVVEPNKTAYKATTQYSYDSVTGTTTQEQVSGVDIVNRTTTLGYDSLFRFVNTTTNGLNQVTSNVVSRNALGEPTQINGLNGTSVQYVYTPLGRQYLEYHNDGHYTRVSRAMAAKPNGQAMTDTILHESGALEAVAYDMLGRVIGKEILLPGYLQFGWSDTEYDQAGRVRHTSEPYIYGSASSSVFFTETNYDAVGRVSSVKAPDGGVTTTTYNGLTTTITDPAGHTKTELRDQMGEISKVTDALSGTVEYSYDVEGHPLTIKTSGATQATGVPASITVTYTYDDVGRRATMSDPDKGNWSYAYDVLGELLTQTDAKGQVISIPVATSSTASQGYDALGRVLTRTDKKANGTIEETTTWSYDPTNGVGEIASVQQANSHYMRTYNYDSLGRENGQSISLTSEGVQYNIARYYDQYGREYQTFDASGNGIQRYYNTQGYFYKASDLSSNFTVGSQLYVVLSLDAAARVTSDGLGLASNGTSPLITRTYVYDAMGRPTSIQSNSGVALQNLSYSYYGVGSNQYGNMSQRQDVTKGLTETFNYDALNRLTSSQVTNQSAVTVSYDSFGNIITKSDRGAYSYATNAGPHAVTSVAGVANTYDLNGNYAGTGSTRTVSYNTFDKPISIFVGGAPSSTFTYGPDRDYYKRLEFSGGTTTETLYLDGVERVYNLSAGTRMDRRYLPGGAYRINNYTGVTSYNVTTSPGTLQSTTVEYLLDDHQGSTDVIVDTNGNVKQAMSFDAWGMRRNPSTWVTLTTAAGFDNSQTSHGYTGHEMVDNANIIHMHGRIYDPRWGRMLQADPYIQDPMDAQAQNRFAYVLNNPLIHTDPTGYVCTSDWSVRGGNCTGYSGTANGVGGLSLYNAALDGAGGGIFFNLQAYVDIGTGPATRGTNQGGMTADLKQSSGWTFVNWMKGLTGKSQMADSNSWGEGWHRWVPDTTPNAAPGHMIEEVGCCIGRGGVAPPFQMPIYDPPINSLVDGGMRVGAQLIGGEDAAAIAIGAKALTVLKSAIWLGKTEKAAAALRNGHLAGNVHPKTGIPFDKDGFPDFSGVTKAEVQIEQTGTRAGDFRSANEAAGFEKTPEGYTWHHHQDGTTMQLVPRDIHAQTGHTGGFQPGPLE